MEEGFTGMGRKPIYALIDGVPMMVKKPLIVRASVYVCIPKELMAIWSLKGAIEYFVLDNKGDKLIISPCYEKVEVGTL